MPRWPAKEEGNTAVMENAFNASKANNPSTLIAERDADPRQPPPPVKKVLVYSIYPRFSITLQHSHTRVQQLANGQSVQMDMGESRVANFQNHRCWISLDDMNDKRDDGARNGRKKGVRSMNRYGYDFIEAVRSEGMPEGALSLEEMFKTQGNRFEGFQRSMEAKSKITGNRLGVGIHTHELLNEIERLKSGELKAPRTED